jgi:arylsulfatase A-like enzyme
MRLNEKVIDPEGHATDLFTQWAIDYIDERAKAGGPFFLYLAYNAPHTPIQPPAEWVAKVKAREPNITDKRAKLVALIEHMDAGIGRVIEALKQAGVYDNTLIVFSSDNGGQLSVGARNGEVRGGKQDMYEGGLRVPMGAAWPGHIPPGSLSKRIALLMDLFPTFCEAAGVKVEHAIDGVSILPTLLGESQTIERDLYWVRREGNMRYQGQDYRAVRRGPWKLMHNTPFEPLELYNLEDDPQEASDLAKSPANRKVFNELTALLRRQIQRGGAVPWQK